MNLFVVRQRLLNILMIFVVLMTSVTSVEDRYELNNAVIGDEVRAMDNKASEAILTDEQLLEMYPDLNLTITRTKGPPVSVMSGKIPDHLIRRMADYLFGLLQGTGEVIKPTTTTTTTTTTPSTTSSSSISSSTSSPEFLPFRAKLFDLAVIRDPPKTAVAPSHPQIRRKPIRKFSGVSRRKSEKLWRKTRMVKTIGMA